MQDDALYVEANMIVIGKMKHKQCFEKKNPKDEAKSSRKNKNKENQEDKIEELTNMLKGLSNKMARFETESNNQRNPKSIGQNDPNKFRWPFNPQTLNRERRNEDSPIQLPVRPNKAIIDVAADEEDIELTEGINMLCDDNKMIHIFKNEYETILMEESSQN